MFHVRSYVFSVCYFSVCFNKLVPGNPLDLKIDKKKVLIYRFIDQPKIKLLGITFFQTNDKLTR